MSGIIFTSHAAADTEAVIDLWRRCDLLRPWTTLATISIW